MLKYWGSLSRDQAWAGAAHLTSAEDIWADFEPFRHQQHPPGCRQPSFKTILSEEEPIWEYSTQPSILEAKIDACNILLFT